MELLLLRHGKAAPHGDARADAGRALVPKGIQQSQACGRYLLVTGFLPEIVLTSPLLRARQTADHFCQSAKLPGPVTQSWLASGMHPDLALRELASFSDFKRICIVGHEPDFSSLIAWVTSSEGGAVEMRKGAIALLELCPPSSRGTLRFLIPPQMMGLSQD
jgi:phosphohistidine phosphatase